MLRSSKAARLQRCFGIAGRSGLRNYAPCLVATATGLARPEAAHTAFGLAQRARTRWMIGWSRNGPVRGKHARGLRQARRHSALRLIFHNLPYRFFARTVVHSTSKCDCLGFAARCTKEPFACPTATTLFAASSLVKLPDDLHGGPALGRNLFDGLVRRGARRDRKAARWRSCSAAVRPACSRR